MSFTYENDWKVSIREAAAEMGYEIFLYRRKPGSRDLEVMQFGMATVITINEESQAVPKSMSIGRDTLSELARAMNSLGFRTDRDAMIEGELKATKDHLSDMRKLVFETNQPLVETRLE